MSTSPPIPPLLPATTHAQVSAFPEPQVTDTVKHTLLNVTSDLLSLETAATFLKTPPQSPYTATLQTLHQRLLTGKPTPNHRPNHWYQDPPPSEPGPASTRRLADFEFLYYALLSKVKSIHQLVCVRLDNRFSAPDERVYASGPTFGQVREKLARYWSDLNQPRFVKALDAAVVRAKVRCLHEDLVVQLEMGEIEHAEAVVLIDELHSQAGSGNVAGLAWIGDWAPSMICAWVEERYRILLAKEKEDDEEMEEKRRREEELARKREEEKMVREYEWYLREQEWEKRYEELSELMQLERVGELTLGL